MSASATSRSAGEAPRARHTLVFDLAPGPYGTERLSDLVAGRSGLCDSAVSRPCSPVGRSAVYHWAESINRVKGPQET